MKLFLLITLVALTSISCGKSNTAQNPDKGNPGPGGQGNPPGEAQSISEVITFCSKLDFSNMPLPAGKTIAEVNSWALSLNITGTFEGKEGWKNITNNFDGQGLSMGLLNQTLGTGSLQPLLIEMKTKHNADMKKVFEAQRFQSLVGMLSAWEKSGVSSFNEDVLVHEDGIAINELDNGEQFLLEILAANNQQSVEWAKSNLYTDAAGKVFKTEWKSELQKLIVVSKYRSIQLNASLKLHEKAMSYMSLFKTANLNSYLFMFDIVVQNGGFYQKNIDEFNAFIKKNPAATENQKLYALLESRLVQVKNQFKADVKARKTALIEGSGKVHGQQRDFKKEYCYQ